MIEFMLPLIGVVSLNSIRWKVKLQCLWLATLREYTCAKLNKMVASATTST